MRKEMIVTAVEETGLPEMRQKEIRACVKTGNYPKAKELLHEGRESLLAEIHMKEDEIRHIDWLIYSLGKAE